jgi:LysR family transcriptional regulator, mexEF-oprN operon transcriptional activator
VVSARGGTGRWRPSERSAAVPFASQRFKGEGRRRQISRGSSSPTVEPNLCQRECPPISNHADQSGLRRLDLNLLPVFAALMRERSVTRAGQALFLSQPATSAALVRLREALKDELLVRNGRVLEPTARATQLLAELEPCLDTLARTLGEATPFDPATDHRIFRVGCTGDVAVALLPVFSARLRELAPRCDLVLRQADYRTIPRMLDSGEIGTAVASYMEDDLPASAKQRAVRSGRRGGFLVVRDAVTPGPVDLDAYCARPHVLVTPGGDLHGFADEALEALGRSRRVLLGLPDYALVRRAVLGTDLLCTLPAFMAEALVASGGFAADPLPFERPGTASRAEIRMAWRATVDQDPAEEWLRARLIEALAR